METTEAREELQGDNMRFINLTPTQGERPMTTTTYRCGCGEWAGGQCGHTAPLSDLVVVEFMPDDEKSSHMAAGNSGCWPHNGAVRVAVTRKHAEWIVGEEGPEWASIVADANPADYLLAGLST